MVISEIRCFARWMTVRFPGPYRCVSWALVNGGVVTTDLVAWRFLEPDEIRHCGDVGAWFRELLRGYGLEHAVGLLTSRKLHQFVESGDHACHVVATVGLSNALAVGDPVAAPAAVAGTINLLCALARPLTEASSLEALSLAAEARTTAMLASGVPSGISGRPASGTGTDCIVIAHPLSEPALEYCGKHTDWGHRIGRHVQEAVSRGIAGWIGEQRR
jgi:adenosylcobinamide amidohydrolase